MESDSNSYYAILNVPRAASEAEIRRAYKTLAQTFHPDKHTSESLRDEAAHGFAQINEAYEVLVSPEKRQIYDIYGKQGLTAGLDVGSKLKSVDELKAEWEKFKAEREMETKMIDVAHDTVLHCMIDSTSLLDSSAPITIKSPEIESILIQSTMTKQLNTHHVGWIGGNVIRQGVDGSNGGGHLLCGCRGMVDARTGYSLDLQWGSKSEAKIQTTQQITESNQGVVTGSFSGVSGMGLSFSSVQTLSEKAQGTASLILGPPEEAGVQLGVHQTMKTGALSAKFQVGAMYSITAKLTKILTSSLTFKAIGRLGFSAIDLDVGLQKQFSPHTNVSLSVLFGIQGTYLKTKWRFGNYALDLPIVLSRDPEDWKVALITVTLTPLSITLCRHFIIKPLLKAYRARVSLQERKKHCEEIQNLLESAQSSQRLLETVAKRITQSEASKSGLVVVKAQFGRFDEARLSVEEEGEGLLPPVVMDVTRALQYLVVDSELELFSGVPKSGLMGFCDLAPKQSKTLKVWYLFHNHPYKAQVGDLDGLKLPRQGRAITSIEESEEILSIARGEGYIGGASD